MKDPTFAWMSEWESLAWMRGNRVYPSGFDSCMQHIGTLYFPFNTIGVIVKDGVVIKGYGAIQHDNI